MFTNNTTIPPTATPASSPEQGQRDKINLPIKKSSLDCEPKFPSLGDFSGQHGFSTSYSLLLKNVPGCIPTSIHKHRTAKQSCPSMPHLTPPRHLRTGSCITTFRVHQRSCTPFNRSPPMVNRTTAKVIGHYVSTPPKQHSTAAATAASLPGAPILVDFGSPRRPGAIVVR
jgi:hypothetical protein